MQGVLVPSVMDDLLSKAYDAVACVGSIGNSMSHLMLALSVSLQEDTLDASVHNFSNTSLQVFALMSRELVRLISTLIQAHHQVWHKLLSLRHVGEPTTVFQWNLGSCLDLRL